MKKHQKQLYLIFPDISSGGRGGQQCHRPASQVSNRGQPLPHSGTKSKKWNKIRKQNVKNKLKKHLML